MSENASNRRDAEKRFAGFESLDANFIYCPNQYLDLCLRHCKRGALRAISFVLVETLKWRDEAGNPINQQIAVPHSRLIKEAKISRGAVGPALKEAVDKGFLNCVVPGQAFSQGTISKTAEYELRWEHNDKYAQSIEAFDGFSAKAGNRSPLPEAFFTQVVPNEPRAIAQIVGVVLRYTVGYEHQFGRRPQAPLSYSFIQERTGISDRTTISQGIRHCLEMNYITRCETGVFASDAKQQRAATYAVKWLHDNANPSNSSKSRPAKQFKNQTSQTVQNPDQDRLKNQTSSGSESRPEKQFNNPTTRKTATKHTHKQHAAAVLLLTEQGFAKPEAIKLAASATAEQIQQQISWLPFREPAENPLGLLRRAIEGQWSEPAKKTKTDQEATMKNTIEKSTANDREQAQTLEAKGIERNKQRAQRGQISPAIDQWLQAPDDLKRRAYKLALDRNRDPDAQTKIHDSSLQHPHEEVLKAFTKLQPTVTTT